MKPDDTAQLSRRDYFAATALQGILANAEALHSTPLILYAEHAKIAYKAADAMIAESNKEGKK